MEIGRHRAALDEDGVLLADAARAAGLDAAVPACPGWRVPDLVRHQAYIHRWAMRHILRQPTEIIDDGTEADILGDGPPDDVLIAACREGHAALVRALREAHPDVRCATFMGTAPTPLGFWGRAGRPTRPRSTGSTRKAPGRRSAEPGQLVRGGLRRRRYRRAGHGFRCQAQVLSGGRTGKSLSVRPCGTPGRWHLSIGGSGAQVSRADHEAAAGSRIRPLRRDDADRDRSGGIRRSGRVSVASRAEPSAVTW